MAAIATSIGTIAVLVESLVLFHCFELANFPFEEDTTTVKFGYLVNAV